MANARTVSGAEAPYESATPAPTTGIERPTNTAMINVDVIAPLSRGGSTASR
jgi:hypothetical protein